MCFFKSLQQCIKSIPAGVDILTLYRYERDTIPIRASYSCFYTQGSVILLGVGRLCIELCSVTYKTVYLIYLTHQDIIMWKRCFRVRFRFIKVLLEIVVRMNIILSTTE